MKTGHRQPHRLRRFLLANTLAIVYAWISLVIAARWWLPSLATQVGMPLGWAIILFVAILPGYLNALLVVHLLFYRYQPVNLNRIQFPPVTILIAAYNEADVILETSRGILQQDYPNRIEVIVVDDESNDRTAELLGTSGIPNLRLIRVKHGGKSAALNVGLGHCTTDVLVTIDADTFLYRNAVKRIMARLLNNPRCAAVAGQVLAKNERFNRMTRTQSWDYMIAIAAVKRQQGLYRGTLVAQGAFSAFRSKAIQFAGGWQDRLGEDIVLTWALLERGYEIDYEPTAFAFTHVPTDLHTFSRQRQRWARGMIEGFKTHGGLMKPRHHYTAFFIMLDLLFPFIDFFYTFAFIPGLILACVGWFYIVGLMTLLVIPLNIAIIAIMAQSQRRFMQYAGLRIRRNRLGLIAYILVYQILLSPICVMGYVKEFLGMTRRW